MKKLRCISEYIDKYSLPLILILLGAIMVIEGIMGLVIWSLLVF